MSRLRNILSREEAYERVASETFPRKTISFYRYVKLEDPHAMRDQLFGEWSELGVLGRIYLAHEGINAQLSVPEHNFDALIANLDSREAFKDMPLKIAVEEGEISFIKLTIKVRKQIVADGLTIDDYDIENVGSHLTAEEWNRLMENSETVVVDMRNRYESRLGQFNGALTPEADTFREELPLVREQLSGAEDRPVLLYCTGGVRCEKASAYLKHHGFKNVNQLYGGIISYAHEIREKGLDNKFLGKNFVFDGRTEESISDDVISDCDLCGVSSDQILNCKNVICNLLFVQCDECNTLLDGCCSMECHRVAHLPEEEYSRLRKEAGAKRADSYRERVRPDLKPLSPADKLQLAVRRWWRQMFDKEKHERLVPLGSVIHFYRKAGVIEFAAQDQLEVGDHILIEGNTTKNYRQKVSELRVAGVEADSAQVGDLVTIPVRQYIRRNDNIYKVSR